MCKKLIIITLLLFTISLCEASLQLMWDGELDVEQVLMNPSDTAIIGVVSEFDVTEINLAIEVSNDLGILDDSNIVYSWPQPPVIIYSDGSRIEIAGWVPFAQPGPMVICDNILLYMESAGDFTVTLYAIDDNIIDGVVYPAGTLFDTIDVTVVPEPMTLVLLAVGGVFLRRCS